jgi:Zn-dependent protease with chaperone function
MGLNFLFQIGRLGLALFFGGLAGIAAGSTLTGLIVACLLIVFTIFRSKFDRDRE